MSESDRSCLRSFCMSRRPGELYETKESEAGNGRSQGLKGGVSIRAFAGGSRWSAVVSSFAATSLEERDAMFVLSLAVFLAGVWPGSEGHVAHRWDKTKILPQMGLNNWRATSFAVSEKKIFLSLVDVAKEESGNGVVGAFNISSSTSPEVTIFPFQNFYKINDPIRGKITTPMAVRTDDCDRLWLLDSAVQDIAGTQAKANPGIYVFNTNTSQLIRSFNIPATQWTSASFFVTFVVDTESVEHDCEQSYGYFADFNRFHLLTYDFLRNRSELKSHPFFSPDPLVHTPEDVLFNHRHQDLNGVFGLALAHHRSALFFHPLAATHEFRISTQALKAEGDLKYLDVEVYKDKGEHTEAGVSVFDPETETIFFAEVNTRKIGAVRLKDPRLTSYYRYDLNLTTGQVVDLNVHESNLWALVDDKSEVVIHKLPIADISEEFRRSRHRPASPTASSSAAVQLNLLHLLVFLPLYGFL